MSGELDEDLGSVGISPSEKPSPSLANEPATPLPRVSERERAVLAALAEAGPENCFSFRWLCHLTTFDRATVRRSCRSLTRKGLARFERGLWSDDGEPRGSGYGPTTTGLKLAGVEQ